MRNRYFFLFVLLACISSGFSQTVIQGKLLSEENQSPIPYANIGILNTSVGTITNNDGTFEVLIPPANENDSLLFSALGYERKSFLVSELMKSRHRTIYLKEHSTILKNVTVKTKKLKPVRTYSKGNFSHNVGSFYVDTLAGGAAMALLIDNTSEIESMPYFVTNARLRIAYNSLNTFRVRIRFLSVSPETGLPDEDLVNESIVAISHMQKGWLDFDLSRYTIRINHRKFFLVYEWILEDDERVELSQQYQEFKKQYPRKVTTDTTTIDGEKIQTTKWEGYRAGTSFGSSSLRSISDNSKCFYRINSYGKWRRSRYVLSATVTIVNYN